MTMNKRESKLTPVAALIVFTLFALCILGVLLTGAESYRRLTDRNSHSGNYRTAVQYISTRVRQADQSGSIRTEDFQGQSALSLGEEIQGTGYVTRVYCHEGYLQELFSPEEGQFHPADGEKLLPMEDLDASIENDMLTVTLTFPDGEQQSLVFCLRSGEEIS